MLLDGVSGFSAENTKIFGLSCHWNHIGAVCLNCGHNCSVCRHHLGIPWQD